MHPHLHFIGFVLIFLALVHVIFPRYFNWKTELGSLSLINRQMMEVHTFFLAFTVLLIGLLCISSADELISTTLGQRIALGLALFWGIRLIFQWFVYSPKLWRGKTFETIVHIIFTAFWIYMTWVFATIAGFSI